MQYESLVALKITAAQRSMTSKILVLIAWNTLKLVTLTDDS